jgi:hypothetical protein
MTILRTPIRNIDEIAHAINAFAVEPNRVRAMPETGSVRRSRYFKDRTFAFWCVHI